MSAEVYEYVMECGGTWKSSFRRTPGARVPCHGRGRCRSSFFGHGAQKLVSGPFAEPRYKGGYDYQDEPITPVYTVWRRSDGYVHASCGHPVDYGHPFTPDDGARRKVGPGFEVLFVTDDWPTAHALIRVERVVAEMAL